MRQYFIFIFLQCVLLTRLHSAHGFEAGDVREVECVINGTPTTLRMVYVPGKIAQPSGQGDGSSVGTTAQLPFFFATTELSLADFEALAPKHAQESHEARERKMAVTKELKSDLARMTAEPERYYAKMVSLSEAAAVTAAMTRSLAETDGGAGSLVQSRFRIPTVNEWRRAASMNSDENVFLNPWPKFSDFSDKERGRCQELWKASGGVGLFVGSQDQMTWLFDEATGEAAGRLEIATIMFRFLLKGRLLDPAKENSHSWEIQPEPLEESIDAAPPTEWGVYGLHRGYPEWVLNVESQGEAIRFWRLVEDEAMSNVDTEKKFFGLSGASSLTLNKSDLTPLRQLSLTHQHVLSGQTAVSWADINEADVCVDRSVTVRLVLVECLADSWVTAVRDALIKSGGPEGTAEKVERLNFEVKRLTAGREQERNLGIIEAWLAISRYRSGEKKPAGEALSSSKLFGGGTNKPKLSPEEIMRMMQRGGRPGGGNSKKKLAPDSLYFKSVGNLMIKEHDDI
jgi:hypothetical protein